MKLFPLSRVAVSVMNNNSNENLFCVCVDQVFAMQLLALRWIYQRLAVTMLAAYCTIATGIHLQSFLGDGQGGSATSLTGEHNETNVTELRADIATCLARSNFDIRRAMYVTVAHKQTQVYMKVNGPKKSNKDEVEVLKRELASHKEEIIELKLQHKELAELTRPMLSRLQCFAEETSPTIDELMRRTVENRRKCGYLRKWYEEIHTLYDFHEDLIQDLAAERGKLKKICMLEELD